MWERCAAIAGRQASRKRWADTWAGGSGSHPLQDRTCPRTSNAPLQWYRMASTDSTGGDSEKHYYFSTSMLGITAVPENECAPVKQRRLCSGRESEMRWLTRGNGSELRLTVLGRQPQPPGLSTLGMPRQEAPKAIGSSEAQKLPEYYQMLPCFRNRVGAVT